MIKPLRENIFIPILLAAGLIAALVLCGVRISREADNTQVSVVMTAEDLAELDGSVEHVREFTGGKAIDGALLLVEDAGQYSYLPFDDGTVLADFPRQVRCFKLFEDFASRYGVLGYEGAEEIENILYRAVTDRNIRVIWLTPFIDSATGEIITDAAVYNEVLGNLSSRIARQGLTLGGSFSVLEQYEPGNLMLLLVSLGVFAAAVLLLYSVCRPPKWLVLIGLLLCPGAMLLLPGLFVPGFAFAASVVFPCLAIWYSSEQLGAMERRSLESDLGSFLRILLISFGVCIVGSAFVGALQSSTAYQLAVNNFRGVKLSQLLPIAFACLFVLLRLCTRKDIMSAKKSLLVILALLLLAAGTYYILRTGNFSVSTFEQRVRNGLEHLLIVRPRTKEFLVAWPCVALTAGLILRGKRAYCWLPAILSSVGFASVLNTFCHSRSPLWLSLTRSLLGLVIGAALGCVVFIIARGRNKNHAG